MSSVIGIYLVPYALTGYNLQVGKFHVSASNLIILAVNISPNSSKWIVETQNGMYGSLYVTLCFVLCLFDLFTFVC